MPDTNTTKDERRTSNDERRTTSDGRWPFGLRPPPSTNGQAISEPTEPLTPWDKVQLARHPRRPHTLDYLRGLCEDFVELHGDRRFGDDPAMVGGVARFNGGTVMVIGHQKGR